jgi:L-alanine-DL-glutamate epimerase-like enolase superfamily enzyme
MTDESERFENPKEQAVTEDVGLVADASLAKPTLADVVPIEKIVTSAYTIPTDGPDGKESDGTFEWASTTMVLVEIVAGGETGLGYTYSDTAAAHLIAGKLAGVLQGENAFAIGSLWREQQSVLRNLGRPGLGAMALSAVDVALWDLKAKLLGVPLYRLLADFHAGVPVYGSGGFCNYTLGRLQEQLGSWVEQGIPRVKIKTSRHPDEDPARLDACRKAIGADTELMTDANGAMGRKQALYWAHRFHGDFGVTWFEEPVSSDDRVGLREVRDHGPPGLDIAAGEYGYLLGDFAELLQARSVDCLQADVTRCGGITGLMQVAGMAAAHSMDLSAHCAPAISTHAFRAVPHLRHLEYFHDHVRIEALLFDGAQTPRQGVLYPDPDRPGLGLELKREDARRYLAYQQGP